MNRPEPWAILQETRCGGPRSARTGHRSPRRYRRGNPCKFSLRLSAFSKRPYFYGSRLFTSAQTEKFASAYLSAFHHLKLFHIARPIAGFFVWFVICSRDSRQHL